MDKKVYCLKCEYILIKDNPNGQGKMVGCDKFKETKRDWAEELITPGNPAKLNKNNNCKGYKEMVKGSWTEVKKDGKQSGK